MAEFPASADAFEELTRAFRGSLASLQAATETLELFPQMDEEQRRRMRSVVSGEARRLGQLVDRLESLGEPIFGRSHDRSREKIAAAELATTLAARAFAQLGLQIEREEGEPATLEVDVDSLVNAVVGLLDGLRRHVVLDGLLLRQRVIEHHAVFDLLWQANEASLDLLRDWQSHALDHPADGGPGLRPTARGHGGEAWFNVDRDRERAYLRLLLPLAG